MSPCRLRLERRVKSALGHLLTDMCIPIKRTIRPLRSIDHRSLHSLSHILILRLRASHITSIKEAHKQIHQRPQIKDIQPSRKRLSWSIQTIHSPISRNSLMHNIGSIRGLSYGLRETLSSRSTVDNGLDGVLRGLAGRSVVQGVGGIRNDFLDMGHGDVVGDEGVRGGIIDADEELADLQGCKGLLDGLGNADVEGGDGVVGVLGVRLAICSGIGGSETAGAGVRSKDGGKGGGSYHQGVNTGVGEAEQPDRGRHVAHSSPHAQHCASVVVGLERGAGLSLGQNDNGIDNLVELAEVEEPSVESEALIPESASSAQGSGRHISLSSSAGNVLAQSWVVCDRVAESSWSLKLAEGVNHADDSCWSAWRWDSGLQPPPHAGKRPRRVDGQKNIVRHDDPVEPPGLGDGPWLVSACRVDAVHGDGGDGVGDRNGERDARIVDLLVERGWNVEWRVGRWWCVESRRVGGGRELEEGGGREGEVDIWRHIAVG